MAPGSRATRPSGIEADLDAGKVSPVYLLVGDDETGKKPVIEALTALVDPELRPLNVERFYATDAAGGSPIVRAVDAARTLPMLGERRVVFLMRAEVVLKRGGAGASDGDDEGPAPVEGDAADEEAGFAALQEYLDAPAEHACLVVVASDVNRRTRLGRALFEQATVVEFWGLRGGKDRRGMPLDAMRAAAEHWVRQRVKAIGKTVEDAAIEPLVQYAGTDMGRLRGAVERVLLYCGGRSRVTRDDVRSVISGEAAVDDWGVTNAIGAGNAREALRELRLALDAGASPYLVLGQIGWFVRTKLPAIARNRAAEAVRLQFACDLAMKTSGGDPQVLLERLVVELCGRGAPTRRLGRG